MLKCDQAENTIKSKKNATKYLYTIKRILNQIKADKIPKSI